MSQTIPEPKQPYEKYPIAVNFSNNMTEEESIILANSIVVAYDMSNQDVSDDILESDTLSVVDDTKLQIVIKNGVSGSKYKLSFRAYISDTKQLEEDVIFKVKD